MNGLFWFSFLFLVGNAQEHLTCLRTNDVFTPTSTSAPHRIQQGAPGKRGPVGPKGDTGSDGTKGDKGDDGVSNNSRINSLQSIFFNFLLNTFDDANQFFALERYYEN